MNTAYFLYMYQNFQMFFKGLTKALDESSLEPKECETTKAEESWLLCFKRAAERR